MNNITKLYMIFSSILFVTFGFTIMKQNKVNVQEKQKTPKLQVFAELSVRPGNVTADKYGNVYATVHPLGNPDFQMIKVTGKTTHEQWPNKSWQHKPDEKAGKNQFDTPLGLVIDENDILWVTDMGLNIGKSRIFAFDIKTKKNVFNYTIPKEIAPEGSFIQDLAVDPSRNMVYLADIANPGIVVVNTKTKKAKRISGAPEFSAEDIDMVIDNKVVLFNGKPARVAVNPITLSKDYKTLYFGAMNGTKWYSLPTKVIIDNAPNEEIIKIISVVGNKPISDGASTDSEGNHFFTNLPEKGIDKLDKTGKLTPFIRDKRLDWPDNVKFGKDSWLYISVNQLHKTPAFTGGKDLGTPPYFIYRVKTNTKGMPGR